MRRVRRVCPCAKVKGTHARESARAQACRLAGAQVRGVQVRRGAGAQGCRAADLHVLLREHEGLSGALVRLHAVAQPLERRDPKAVTVQQQCARRVRAAQQR